MFRIDSNAPIIPDKKDDLTKTAEIAQITSTKVSQVNLIIAIIGLIITTFFAILTYNLGIETRDNRETLKSLQKIASFDSSALASSDVSIIKLDSAVIDLNKTVIALKIQNDNLQNLIRISGLGTKARIIKEYLGEKKRVEVLENICDKIDSIKNIVWSDIDSLNAIGKINKISILMLDGNKELDSLIDQKIAFKWKDAENSINYILYHIKSSFPNHIKHNKSYNYTVESNRNVAVTKLLDDLGIFDKKIQHLRYLFIEDLEDNKPMGVFGSDRELSESL